MDQQMKALLSLVLLSSIAAAQEFPYQRPAEPIASVLEAPLPPRLTVSPTNDKILVVTLARYRSISDLAQPMLPLAGVRINPLNNGPSRPLRTESLVLQDLRSGKKLSIALPKDGIVWTTSWSPDGKWLAMSVAEKDRVQILVVNAATGSQRMLPMPINATQGSGFIWMPDSRTLLVHEIVPNRGPAPTRADAPGGPEVQESLGAKKPARTFPDALRDAFAEQQLRYYMSSQLALVDAETGHARPIGKPGIFRADPSPDGKLLLVEEIRPPFSHRIYLNGFPKHISVMDLRTGQAKAFVDKPGEEGIPLDGVVTGLREMEWQSNAPETLLAVKALDGGDPRAKAEFRDELHLIDWASGKDAAVMKLRGRYQRLYWPSEGSKAIVEEYDRDKERDRRYVLDLSDGASDLLSDISTREQYNNPGSPVERPLPNGHLAMQQNGNLVLFEGMGASPTGDRPFLDSVNLASHANQRIWRCDNDHYERVLAALANDGSSFITRRESPQEPPNYYIHDRGTSQLTDYKNSFPDLLKIKKQLVTYKRPDGVDLSFTLLLPPNYHEGERLPAIIDAYPLEFTDASVAGQVTGSTKTFPILATWQSFVLAGFAVMDRVAMPIVGNPETVNDTYVQQLVADTKAAIDKAAEMGVIDANRVGIMGHSYGAFMTANVLAHSDLVKAGAAESGAYNRTLTPFGFQSERRTFWQAQQMYLTVSPFAFADKIKRPLLLIHGLQDDNPGTYTIQSQRFYDALAGNGGTVRLVLLPFEAHGYAARESIEHVVAEELRWFDKYVKNLGEGASAAATGHP